MMKFFKSKKVKVIAMLLVVAIMGGVIYNTGVTKKSKADKRKIESENVGTLDKFSDEDIQKYDSYVTFSDEKHCYELIKEKSTELSENVRANLKSRIDATNNLIRDYNLTKKDIEQQVTKAGKHVPQIAWYGVYWHMSKKQLDKVKAWLAIGIGATELASKLCTLFPEVAVTKPLAAALQGVAIILVAAETWLLICEQINPKGVKVRFILSTYSVVILPI